MKMLHRSQWLAVLLIPFGVQAQAGAKEAPAVKRDPFWPVGYLPDRIRDAQLTDSQRALKSISGNEDWGAAMKGVAINGVSSRGNSEFFAVINGQVRRVGERVAVSHGGMSYTWVIDGIKPPGSVKLRRISVQ